MAMMMTGRVLLVCALCVLWCGAGGRCDEGVVEGRAGGGGSAEPPPESEELVTSPETSQGLKGGVPGVKGNAPPAFPTPTEEDDDEEDDSDDDEDEETDEAEKKTIEGQSVQGGKAAQDPGSREKNLSGSDQEIHQSIAPAGDISHSDSQESKAIPTQTEFEKKKEPDENTPAVENALKRVNGENSLHGGGNLPSSPKDSVDSREKDGEDPTSGDKKVFSHDTAATPQSHRDEGSEGTGKDTKATTVTANTTDTTNTQNSDSSTTVSHTTSPLLLLLVACAAAAAVVAA
ncbi:hypothetical protein TcYC6_0039980 [Trypanosoma cruzi]|nr:hypothetical protein TcYC6_0039980 [Trypanosoma cruzi]